MQPTQNIKTILASTLVAAGATDITNAAVIDTEGYQGVRFIFAFGAIVTNAVTSVAAAMKDTNNPVPGTDDIAGSKIAVADSADDTIFILEIRKPVSRYVRPFVKRATQNATLNCIIAELFDPIAAPVAADTTVTAQNLLISPANGVA